MSVDKMAIYGLCFMFHSIFRVHKYYVWVSLTHILGLYH